MEVQIGIKNFFDPILNPSMMFSLERMLEDVFIFISEDLTDMQVTNRITLIHRPTRSNENASWITICEKNNPVTIYTVKTLQNIKTTFNQSRNIYDGLIQFALFPFWWWYFWATVIGVGRRWISHLLQKSEHSAEGQFSCSADTIGFRLPTNFDLEGLKWQ